MVHTHIDSSAAVRELASGLFDPQRDRPWVVVSSRFNDTQPALDVAALVDEVGDVCRIFTIPTGDLTFELSDLLPDRLQVYGGAGRSYPVGFTATTSASSTKLRFPNGDASAAISALVNDVLAHAQSAGLFDRAPARSQRATGVVTGFTAGGTRAMVALDRGPGLATIWVELTYPPLPLEWTVREQQRVEGVLDLDTRRFNVTRSAPSIDEVRDAFPHLSVTLALVQETSATDAVLALHPDHMVRITRHDVSPNPLDRVNALLSYGDVVAARVIHLSDGGVHLRLADVDDDDEILPALSLVEHGPPWLVEGRSLTEAGDIESVELVAELDEVIPVFAPSPASPVPAVPAVPPSQVPPRAQVASRAPSTRPVPGPGPRRIVPFVSAAIDATRPDQTAGRTETQAPQHAARATALQSTQRSLEEARRKISSLEEQLARVGAADSDLARLREDERIAKLRAREALAELAEARHVVAALRDEHRELKQQLFKARKTMGAASPAIDGYRARREQWVDADEWVRHEVYLAWIDRVAPSERRGSSCPSFRIGPAFASSLESLDGAQKGKAFKAVIDVLSGRAKDMPGRAVHALRSGDGATAADVARADGARCMRVYIEQNTPSARRLHYWVIPGGVIELSRIVVHDDYSP